MTYGELKETETYINAKDIEINVNMEESIDEEYFYVDEFCLLDDLQVIGTANMADGTLHIDLVCANWDKRFEPDWIPESRQNQISIWKIKQQTNIKHLENIIPDAFLLQEMEELFMVERFTITTIVENGYPHYKVHDNLTDNEIHCDLNELNETIWQLLEVQEVLLCEKSQSTI